MTGPSHVLRADSMYRGCSSCIAAARGALTLQAHPLMPQLASLASRQLAWPTVQQVCVSCWPSWHHSSRGTNTALCVVFAAPTTAPTAVHGVSDSCLPPH